MRPAELVLQAMFSFLSCSGVQVNPRCCHFKLDTVISIGPAQHVFEYFQHLVFLLLLNETLNVQVHLLFVPFSFVFVFLVMLQQKVIQGD